MYCPGKSSTNGHLIIKWTLNNPTDKKICINENPIRKFVFIKLETICEWNAPIAQIKTKMAIAKKVDGIVMLCGLCNGDVRKLRTFHRVRTWTWKMDAETHCRPPPPRADAERWRTSSRSWSTWMIASAWVRAPTETDNWNGERTTRHLLVAIGIFSTTFIYFIYQNSILIICSS